MAEALHAVPASGFGQINIDALNLAIVQVRIPSAYRRHRR
jgi:hypothetical protein